MKFLTRRQVLSRTAKIIAGGTLASGASLFVTGCSDAQQPNELNTLAGITYDLFPYEGLSPEIYARLASMIAAQDNPLVTEGLSQIATLTNNVNWIDVDESERIRILTSLENTPFFALVRSTAIDFLYSDPALWEIVGYGGSAIEQGGYINRGFDDISWLPETN